MRSAHLATIYELRMLGKSLSKSLFQEQVKTKDQNRKILMWTNQD